MDHIDATITQKDVQERYNSIWMNRPEYRRHSPEFALLKHLDMSRWDRQLLPKVLIVGAGYGQGFRLLQRIGFDVQASDIADCLRTEYADCIGKFTVAEAHNLPFKDNEFNVGVCVDVLEHIPKNLIAQSLKEIQRVTKNVLVLGVCCVPSELIRNLHLTVLPPSRWLQKFEELGTIKLINGSWINLAVVIEKEAPSVRVVRPQP